MRWKGFWSLVEKKIYVQIFISISFQLWSTQKREVCELNSSLFWSHNPTN
jgi:hypothetical protein